MPSWTDLKYGEAYEGKALIDVYRRYAAPADPEETMRVMAEIVEQRARTESPTP